MLAHERARIDDNARGLSELGVSDWRDRRFAKRRSPLRRRMNRNARERDAMGWANDDDSPWRLGAARPGAERCRRNRTRVNEAGMRCDDDLWRDAAIGPSAFARIRDQCVQRIRRRRVKYSRDLRRVDRLGIVQRRRQRVLLRYHLARAAELFGKVLELRQPVLNRQDRLLIVEV